MEQRSRRVSRHQDGSARSSTLPATSTVARPSINVVTAQDYEELQKNYKFVLPPKQDDNNNNSNKTWQERMVEQYHQHLYKEFAIVDLSVPGKIGLRFRTQAEVVSGRGFRTCASKHCPSYQQPDAIYRDAKMTKNAASNDDDDDKAKSDAAVGEGLCDYEVPFRYVEQNETKMELVKVRLCQVCAPLLMERSASRRTNNSNTKQNLSSKSRDKTDNNSKSSSSSSSGGGGGGDDDSSSISSSDDDSSSSDDSSKEKSSRKRDRRHKTKKKRKHRTSEQSAERKGARKDDHHRRRRRKDRHRDRKRHKK